MKLNKSTIAILMILFVFITPVIGSIKTEKEVWAKAQDTISEIDRIDLEKRMNKDRSRIELEQENKIFLHTVKDTPQDKDISDLKYKATILEKEMLIAIHNASLEFNVPEGLIIGIANAESSLGKNFHKKGDKQCYNYWGLKNPNREMMQKRINEGSWLRCFNGPEAGARTIAKTLRLYYLDEGRITAEQISNKYVGRNQSAYHSQWIINVNKYYK